MCLMLNRIKEDIHPGILAMFEGTKVLQVKPELQGNWVDQDVVIFGASAGFNIRNENLLHEMAHFVEIDQRRIARSGWGLDCKTKVRVMGQYCNEPRTCQATLRECRTIAYQKNLADFLGIEHDHVDFCRSLQFMPDTTWVPLQDGSMPYAENNMLDLSTIDIRKSQHVWCCAKVEEYRKELTAGKFLAEWYRRRSVLEQRVKRKGCV